MSTVGPAIHKSTSAIISKQNELEYFKRGVSRLGVGVIVVFGILAFLHLRMEVNQAFDFTALIVAWGMLLLVGLKLSERLKTWFEMNKPVASISDFGKDPSALRLNEERDRWSKSAKLHNQKRLRWVVAASLLSPVTVLLLSSEILLKVKDVFAVALIIGEIIMIGIALLTVRFRWPFGKAHETWVPARLRAELLRRELFLYGARIGPYLNCPITSSFANKQIAGMRLNEITSTQCKEPELELFRLADLLDMAHYPSLLRSENIWSYAKNFLLRSSLSNCNANNEHITLPMKLIYWRDSLEDAYRLCHYSDANTITYFRSYRDLYLRERLRSQKDGYFGFQKVWHEYRDTGWEIMSGLTLWLAGGMAILHLGLMKGMHGPSSFGVVDAVSGVDISALILPPLGAFFIALRAYFEDHRLSRSYDDLFRQLSQLEKLFEDIDDKLPDFEVNLKRLILQTETLLSHEIRRWWHIVSPEVPKGS